MTDQTDSATADEHIIDIFDATDVDTYVAQFPGFPGYADRREYLGLVVCGSPLRSQWESEADRFFPEAMTVILESKTCAEQTSEFVDTVMETGTPGVMICSYHTVRVHHRLFMELGLDICVVDEARVLAGTGSKLQSALWDLRDTVKVGLPMTGTAVDKNIDELGRILAWSRNDRELFNGKRLSQRFDLSKAEEREAMWDAIGPTVFRRDRSALKGELPRVDSEVILLDPHPTELALADGAVNRLRDMLADLEEKIERAAMMRPDDPEIKAVRDELKHARGAVLGGITVARKAATAPATVRHSQSAAVALLDAAGLVEPAIKYGGTKIKQIAELVVDLADNDEAVLVFTDFAEVAQDLHDRLAERGVRVGMFTGKMTDKRRTANRYAYQGKPCAAHKQGGGVIDGCGDCQHPTLDVLIMTASGREGLNLQRTNVLINMDMPWVPSQIVQRIGRAVRFGSDNDSVQVLTPIMRGTIEERVIAKLMPRAMTALAALDAHRGVNVQETELGLALQGLAEVVDEDKADTADLGMLALAKDVLADHAGQNEDAFALAA